MSSSTESSSTPTAAREEEPDSCCICCAVLTHDLSVVVPCGHVYHSECIQEWFTKRGKRVGCPLCNRDGSAHTKRDSIQRLNFDGRLLMGPGVANQVRVDTAQSELAEQKAEISRLSSAIEDLKSELEERQLKISSQNAMLEAVLKKLSEEESAKTRQLRGELDLRRELKAVQQELESTKRDLIDAQTTLRKEQSTYKHARIEVDNLIGENNRLQTAMRSHVALRQERDQLEEQVRQLRLEKRQAENRLDRLAQTNAVRVPSASSSLVENLDVGNKKRIALAKSEDQPKRFVTSSPDRSRPCLKSLAVDFSKVKESDDDGDGEYEIEIVNDVQRAAGEDRPVFLTSLGLPHAKPVSFRTIAPSTLASSGASLTSVPRSSSSSSMAGVHSVPSQPQSRPKQMKMDQFFSGDKS